MLKITLSEVAGPEIGRRRRRISTRSGCSCGSCESSWNAALAWNTVQIGVLINGIKLRREAVSRKTLARVSPLVHRHIIPSGTYRFRDQRSRLE